MLLFSLVLTLAGCAKTNSCEAYIDAAAGCASAAGADDSVYDADVICGAWGEEEELNFGEWYTCQATAYEDADCSTVEGFQAAVDDAASCPQSGG